DGRRGWEAVLATGTEAGALLAACVERGVIPTRFDSSEPTLHEVFVAVPGARICRATRRHDRHPHHRPSRADAIRAHPGVRPHAPVHPGLDPVGRAAP